MNAEIDELESELARDFEQHPDAKIFRSLPGLGTILGARVLGEFGDDPNRYARCQVSQELRRHVTDHQRLGHATCRARPPRPQHAPRRRDLPVGLLRASPPVPGARAFYDAHRHAGDTHHRRSAPSATDSSASSMAASPRHPLRRTHRLGPPFREPTHRGRLTSSGRGISRRISTVARLCLRSPRRAGFRRG